MSNKDLLDLMKKWNPISVDKYNEVQREDTWKKEPTQAYPTGARLKELLEEMNALSSRSANWPYVENSLGILFIEDDMIKIKTLKGESIVIASLNDDKAQLLENLLSLIAKMVLKK